MKQISSIFLLCLLCLLLSGCQKKAADDVVVLDYGIYHATAAISGLPELGQEPELMYINVRELDETTTTVPAVSETCFGFRLDCKSMPSPCHLRLEYEHPPFRSPHDRDPTTEIVEADVTNNEDVDVVWWFDDRFEYEMVAGDWTFRAFVDDKLVDEKTFNVVER